jgi:hypothetical protein
MKNILLSGLAVLMWAAPARGVEILANYNVIPVGTAPVVDGKLDEPCWKAAETSDIYYKYLAQKPVKGEPPTAFKMVYDAKGIYLAIINYEKNMDKLRAKAIARDDGNLWYDDCAEIYFDPYASSIGFIKFAVNSIGTQWDMKRIDTAIELANWSGNNWTAATSKTPDAWIIEMFIPWSDLGREAREGDVWRFTHVRYAWTSGGFKGVSSSLGGGYYASNRFGFLRFAGKSKPNLQTVVDVLAKNASPPWMVLLDGMIVRYDVGGKVSSLSPADFVKAAKAGFEKADARLKELGIEANREALADKNAGPKMEELDGYLTNSLSASISKADTPMAALELGTLLQSLALKADTIYWQIKSREYIAEVAKKQCPVK